MLFRGSVFRCCRLTFSCFFGVLGLFIYRSDPFSLLKHSAFRVVLPWINRLPLSGTQSASLSAQMLCTMFGDVSLKSLLKVSVFVKISVLLLRVMFLSADFQLFFLRWFLFLQFITVFHF